MSQTYHVVGNTHVVTRAYAPDALSTVRCVNSLGVGENHPSVEWEAINYNDLYAPIPLSESLRRIDRCFTNRADNDIWGNWMRFPQISLPQDVSELDPTWSTCSGVGLGAMDPPRALVPAAGWEDSPPPSVPADPPSPQPLTESAPSLPKATPGKTVPDPVPRPTSEPQKGTDPVPQPVAQPNNNPPKDSQDPPPNPQPDSPKPSPIPKEPSKSPAAAAPQPQQPSPNPPVVSPAAEGNSAPGNGAGPQPSTGDNKPAVEQASGDQGKQQPANPDPLKSVSAVLFPNPSPNPDSGKQATDGGSGGQAPSNVQHPTAPDSQEASPSRGAKDGPPSGQTPQGTQNTGNSGSNPPSAASPQDHSNSGSNPPAANPPDQSNSVSNPPSAASPQDQSQSTNDQTNPNVNTPSESGSHSAPANNGESQAEVSGTSGGSNPGQTTGKSGSNGSSNVGSPQAGSDLQGNNAGTNPKDGPTTFAFVSNVPPPVAGDHTVGRAPGGAAVVGTATIPQGEAQVLHGTPVSVGPSAIVVGPETFAFSPPQEAGTPAAAPVVSQAPGGGLVVGSKTILPGQKDSVNGHDVSVGSSNVVIDGNSIAFPTVTPPPSTEPVNIAGVQIAHASGNAFVIGGSTYKAGAQVTVSGHTVSVGSGEVAVDGTSHSFPSAPAFSPLLVDGQTMQKASDGHVIIGTATLSPGSRTTMAGQVISVGADNNVVVGSSSYTLPETAGVVKVPTSPDAAPTAPLMVGSQTVSKDANGHIIVGSSTISAGSEVTMDGHIISAASDKVIVDHSTYDLPATAGAVKIPAAAATPITLPNGAVLTPGATAITVSGEVISVFSNDKGFVIDGSTVTLPTVVTPLVAAQSVFTVAGEVFTAAPSGFSIGGTTVSAGGPAVTISGTVVSLGTAGDLRIGSKTIELPTSTAGTQPVLGDVIMSAFNDQGGGGSAATTGGSPGGAGMPTPTPTPTGSGANSQSGSSRNAKNVPGLLLVLAAIFMGFLVL